MNLFRRTIFVILSVGVLGYCVTVLAYVTSSPDLRLRTLMIDDNARDRDPRGVRILATPGLGLDEIQGAKPEKGDLIVRIGNRDAKTETFYDLTRQISSLRNEPIPPGGQIDTGTDPSELSYLPWLVEDPDGRRWVEIEFIRKGDSEPLTSYVLVQPLPLGEVLLSFIWFVLQLGVFVFGALAYWNRPFDRVSRLFFIACLVTLGAYVGGFHWWVVASRLWLNIPFSVCGILVPVVTLHFFLVFPRQKQFFARSPLLLTSLLYSIPVVALIATPFAEIRLQYLTTGGEATENVAEVLDLLDLFRRGIYAYFVVAGAYFVLSLIALWHSLSNARNPMERGQLRWIWWAGMFASLFVGYTLYLAMFEREQFALGAARVPMFVASLSFMLAYSVGILRYRLMVVDQIVGKGMMYSVVSNSLTIVFSLLIALSALAPQLLNISLTQRQLLTLMVVLMFAVILLLWMRDAFQQGIDRQFFREKYQLDKALERLNLAVGHLVDPEALAEMMLSSCRDVLGIECASLYLRTAPKGPFQLLATEGSGDRSPLQIRVNAACIDELKQGGFFQRVSVGSRQRLSPIQHLLHEMQADLAHSLEVDSQIVGLVFLGRKNHSGSFTAEDLTFLNALGQITNVALHSAKVDRDMARLNEDMRLNSEKITEQRRQIALLQAEVIDHQDGPEVPEERLQGNRRFLRSALKGSSPAIREVLEMARKVAGSESTVLIRGESGTGKELLAEILHENSPRHSGPLIRVHCASLSPSLLESELFGHVKGAFTGADRDRVGRFEMANGGTLFLDEIGDIALETQIKLLRVLQDQRFEPVGGSRTIRADVRLMTATHQNLEALIVQERFREDLYYRLNVISITLPPLRERKEDLYKLALHFLNESAARAGKRINYIDDDAFAALERHRWPGNIRELKNAIERAVVLADDERITLKDLPSGVVEGTRNLPRHAVEPDPARRKPLPAFDDGAPVHGQRRRETSVANDLGEKGSEREILVQTLRDCGGNKAQAARKLGLPRSTFFSRLKRYRIE